MKINIGYEFYSSAKALDPAKIIDLYQSNLIENFFSRIVEFDTSGNLTCVLCNKFWVEGATLFFEFRSDLETVDGVKITAKDALKTYQRIINSKTNTHGNLSNFIDITDKDSITVEGNILKIKMLQSHFSQFLLPLLASMDFSIIPSTSIDNEKNHGGLDFRNTSGPYYLEKDSEKGELVLAANPKHPFYSNQMPLEVHIVPVVYGRGVEDFLEGKIDVLDVTYYPGLPQYEKLFNQKEKKFNFHKTLLINVFLINFSPKATKEFSSKQLFHAGNVIAEVYKGFKRYGYGFQEVFEFFQSTGSGHLNQVQIDHLKKLRVENKSLHFSKPIELGVTEEQYPRIKKALEQYPEIHVKAYPEDPSFMPLEKRPHVYVQVTDSSFNEDISLLSYNFSMGYFGDTAEEGNQWVKDFIKLANQEDRIKKLQKFQLEILEKPVIYPIGASPYWAISRDDLELNFSENFPGSSWWKIRKK